MTDTDLPRTAVDSGGAGTVMPDAIAAVVGAAAWPVAAASPHVVMSDLLRVDAASTGRKRGCDVDDSFDCNHARRSRIQYVAVWIAS